MTLEAVYDDKGKIPQGLETHYIEVDGQFVLDVPGMKTQADFDKYAEAIKKRYADSAADLAKRNGQHLTRDEIMEVVQTALEKTGEIPGKGKGNGQDPGGDVAKRLHDLERNVASLQEENTTLKKERDQAQSNATTTTIRNELTTAAAAAGAQPEGVANLVSLVQPDFEVTQDGNVVTKLDGKNGVSPNLGAKDYFAQISRNPAFRMFWPASKGAGADAGAGTGAGAGGDLGEGNPWSKAGWNMTKQSSLYKSNPTEAQRLMDVAGVKLGATAPVR